MTPAKTSAATLLADAEQTVADLVEQRAQVRARKDEARTARDSQAYLEAEWDEQDLDKQIAQAKDQVTAAQRAKAEEDLDEAWKHAEGAVAAYHKALDARDEALAARDRAGERVRRADDDERPEALADLEIRGQAVVEAGRDVDEAKQQAASALRVIDESEATHGIIDRDGLPRPRVLWATIHQRFPGEGVLQTFLGGTRVPRWLALLVDNQGDRLFQPEEDHT